MPVIDSDFRPHALLGNRHVQTIFPSWFRRRPSLPLSVERLELDDGDFLDLAHYQQDRPDAPLALVMHGLEGSLESHYAGPVMAALHKAGFQVSFMHFRGCSGEHNRLQRRYHSGETDDLRQVIAHLRRSFGERPLFATGVSLGANVLLKYLGESGEHSEIQAAVPVSVPFDLANAARTLRSGISRVYQGYLLKMLVDATREKFASNPDLADGLIDQQALAEIKTIYEFDDRVTAPLHDFSGADDYYARSSSGPYLQAIRVPVHILHAKDDPFMTPQAIPPEQALADSVTLELSEHGGHVGFVGSCGGRPWYWLEGRVAECLLTLARTAA